MKVEEAKKIVDRQFESLVSALEQGQSDALKAYFAAMAKFHQYSFRNLMLIFSQRPDATRVAGFNTWKKLGRWVKKGEKGIVIIAPMVLKPKDEQPDREDDKPAVFKASHVFDVSQTEGDSLPEFSSAQGDPGKYMEQLTNLISGQGIKLNYSSQLGSADGASTGGTILLKEGLSPAAEFSVLVHELAHEMMHRSPEALKRGKKVVETEAEAVAAIISEAVGLSSNTASSDYIQLYSGDAELLRTSLEAVQRVSSQILSALLDD